MLLKKTGGKTGETGGTAGVTASPAKPVGKPGRAAKVDPSAGLTLPSDFDDPMDELGDFNWLIYGDYKIGKTSLTSRWPDPFHLMFEPGGKGLRIRKREVPTWRDFQGYVKLLRSTSQYQTIMIDTTDMAYMRCFKHVANVNGFEHPTDENDFGKSWDKIRDEFMEQILLIAATGRGIVFVSHAEVASDVQNHDGTKFNQIIPSMAKQARKFIGAWVDVIAYYGYFGKERALMINGTTDLVMSGHRIENHFLTPEGERIHAIPMGDSADQAWASIVHAFNNNQEVVYEPSRVAPLAGTQVKKERKR